MSDPRESIAESRGGPQDAYPSSVQKIAGDRAVLGHILDTTPDPLLVFDIDGVIRFANRNLQLLSGYTADELVGAPVVLLIPSWDAGMLPVSTDGPASRPVTLSALQARDRSGRTFPVEISVSMTRIDGRDTCTASVRDIGARLEREREADRMREELIANISHELRTPLTSIIGYIEILGEFDEAEVSPRARRLVEVIERNANRELRLVNDLLTMSFVDRMHDRLVLEPVQLVDVGRRVTEATAPMAAAAGLVLVLEASADPTVHGDPARILQLLENLVVNSCKFTPRGGRILVRVHEAPGVAVLEVSDTGIGVTAEEKERIFDRMYRAPRAVESHTPGAGLGLSIVKAIADAHGATVTVDGQVDVGTTVRVEFPARGQMRVL